MTEPVQLLIIALAAARVTVLVVDDVVLELPRGRLLARLAGHPYLSYLITCHRCAGFWVSALWAGAWLLAPDVTWRLGLPWAVAAAAWWLTGAWLEEGDPG